jgi:hypothetical protein
LVNFLFSSNYFMFSKYNQNLKCPIESPKPHQMTNKLGLARKSLSRFSICLISYTRSHATTLLTFKTRKNFYYHMLLG